MADSNPEKPQEDQKALILLSLPFASFSLTLSTLLPTNPLLKPSAGIPTQASYLSTTLSLTSTAKSKLKPSLSFKSSVSAVPLHSPLSLTPRRPSDPSSGAALRRSTVVWFRFDLRVADNECLNSAHSDSASVLPVFVFDPRDYGKSSTSGFDKTGPFRAAFLIDSVADLRTRLRARGSDLVVRLGRPEEVLRELAKSVGAEAVYASREVSHDEARAEERVEAAAKDEGVEVKYFWGSTLYHLDDLPFKLEDMPANYGGFQEKVKGLSVRQTFEALDHLKALPKCGDVEVGDIPTLSDLGVSPIPPPQDGKPTANGWMVGGETEAMERLKKFAAECQAQVPTKGGKHDSVYGANFSCKISPWLTMGCLSPRTMFDELKKTTARTISASSNMKDGGAGMNWLLFELLWRDFFRFITKKYSSAKKQLDNAPTTAGTGAFA